MLGSGYECLGIRSCTRCGMGRGGGARRIRSTRFLRRHHDEFRRLYCCPEPAGSGKPAIHHESELHRMRNLPGTKWQRLHEWSVATGSRRRSFGVRFCRGRRRGWLRQYGAPAPNLAEAGIAANSLASTPYNVATGGTDFLDTSEGTNSTYWSTANTPSGSSANSYVPEMTWNDSCASSVLYAFVGYSSGVSYCNSILGSSYLDLGAAGGAPSFVYAKPYWQTNVPGIPNDGVRDLPDISLFASNGFWSHAVLLLHVGCGPGRSPLRLLHPRGCICK